MAEIRTAPSRRLDPAESRANLGMRTVRWVRVLVRPDGGTTCHAVGVGHRLPRVRRVPLATALTLAAEGVPCVVRSLPDEAAAAASSG